MLMLALSSVCVPTNNAPLATSQGGSQATEWQRFTVSDEEFSVLLPTLPAMSTSELYVAQGIYRRERVLGAYADGVVYAIYAFEKRSISLADVARKLSQDPNQSPQVATVGGFTGKLFKFESDSRVGATEFFDTGNYIYAFHCVGSKLRQPAAGISKFLSSIQLGKNLDGQRVADGPGGQSESQPASAGDGPVFSGKLVNERATVITKPEPSYTEAARQNQITGTVVLRGVFSSSGRVTNLIAVVRLPDGLTEQAIASAKQIRFIPAIKDGHFVHMWIELQYNFNLY